MTYQRNFRNASKAFSIMVLILIFANSWLYSQDKNPSLKFGIEAGVGLFKPADINQLIDSWLHEQFDIVEVQGDISLRPDINLSGYLAYAFIKNLELRLEMEYINSPPKFDSFDNDDLNITITSYSPGISLNLKLDNIQIGCGIFRHFAKIKWEDNVFYYSDIWKGDNYGFHINLGFYQELLPHFGFSSTILYRKIIIDELRNKNNQVLIHIPDDRKFTLDLSGFEFRLGLYFSF